MAQINNKENNSDYRIQMIAVAGKFFTYEEYSASYSIISDTTDNDGVRGAVLTWFPEVKTTSFRFLFHMPKIKTKAKY